MVALANTMIGGGGEDIAQEAMLRAHRRWSEVSTYERPGAWLRRVVINLASSGLRRRGVELRGRLRLLGERPEPIVQQPVDHDLRAALASLPPKQRAAIALHYLEDRPVAEIAEILGCAPATAKVHLHRGRAALAARLAPEGDQ